jgi:hypothetical protein
VGEVKDRLTNKLLENRDLRNGMTVVIKYGRLPSLYSPGVFRVTISKEGKQIATKLIPFEDEIEDFINEISGIS